MKKTLYLLIVTMMTWGMLTQNKAYAIVVVNDSLLNIKVASVSTKVDSIKHYLQIAGKKKYKNEKIFHDVKVTMTLEFKPKVIPGKPYDHKALKHKMRMHNYRLSQAKYYLNIINRRPKTVAPSAWGPYSTNKNVKYTRGWLIRAMK